MDIEFFSQDFNRLPSLSDVQVRDLEKVAEISERFHLDAGIPPAHMDDISPEIVVIESGHQPNFLPPPGTWRKAFMLDYIARRLREDGKKVLPVFGFPDYNISTAAVLHQTRIPDVTKVGYRRVGFDIGKSDRWKRFNAQPAPGKEALDAQVDRIIEFYETDSRRARMHAGVFKANIGGLLETLRVCRDRARNFADYNAYLFSRVCSEFLGTDVMFFRYSQVQEEGIFRDTSAKLMSMVGRFNEECNSSVRARNLEEELGTVEDFYVPFWFHCVCGGKVKLTRGKEDASLCFGKCPVCGRDHDVRMDDEGIRKSYGDIAPTAVARNIIFAEGLGDRLFLSGSGGSLRYGQVSNDVSDALGFRKPVTCAWTGQDRFLPVSYAIAAKDLMKALGRHPDDLAGIDVNAEILEEKRKLSAQIDSIRLDASLSEDDRKRSLWRFEGMLKNITAQEEMSRTIASVTPSAVDLFATVGFGSVVRAWTETLGSSVPVREGEFTRIRTDIAYDGANMPEGFSSIDSGARYELIRSLAEAG